MPWTEMLSGACYDHKLGGAHASLGDHARSFVGASRIWVLLHAFTRYVSIRHICVRSAFDEPVDDAGS